MLKVFDEIFEDTIDDPLTLAEDCFFGGMLGVLLAIVLFLIVMAI